MTKGAQPLAFAALLCVTAVADAQEREALARLSGFWMAKFVDEPHGQALIDELPKARTCSSTRLPCRSCRSAISAA